MELSDINSLTGIVIGAAIEVHRLLGPGLLESTYEKCLCKELSIRKVGHQNQVELPVDYKGEQIDCGYRIDLIVERRLVVELKACQALQAIHEAQLLTYLRLSRIKHGLLINFNVPVLKEGIKRLVL